MGMAMSVCNPLSYSLIRDYFPPQRRATANSLYSSGIYVGNAIASLNILFISKYGWRDGFMAVGILGGFFALLGIMLLSEPEKGKFTVIKMEKVEKESKQSGISSKMGGVNRSTRVSLAASPSTQRDLTMIPEIEDENRESTLEPPA